jgi:hypothetical protein
MDSTLTPMSETQYDAWAARPKLIVTGEYGFALRIGKRPEVVGDLVAGDILALDRRSDDNYFVAYPDGRSAIIDAAIAEPLQQWLERVETTGESIVTTARRFSGVPYLWGGTSAKALDCSGFVRTVYFLNGVLLPRDADQQACVGEPIPLDKEMKHLFPGDLLFFAKQLPESQPPRIVHVAISLGGKRFIQASGDVNSKSLDPADSDFGPLWLRSLTCARRIVGARPMPGVRLLREIPYYAQQGAAW